MAIASYDLTSEEGIPVDLPSGAKFLVLTRDEAKYLRDRVKSYMDQNKFVNMSDLQDVDKMVVFELLIHRWSLWLSKGRDYYDEEVNEKSLSQQVEAFSKELRLIKQVIGIDKKSRDKQRGEDSVSNYLDNLKRRAYAFGIMRDKQHAKTIELFQQLKAMLTYYDNCDKQEREEQNITTEDFFDWIRNVAIPEFDSIDVEHRKAQSMYVREM